MQVAERLLGEYVSYGHTEAFRCDSAGRGSFSPVLANLRRDNLSQDVVDGTPPGKAAVGL